MASQPEPAAACLLHINIEAFQSVFPMKATEAGVSRRIASAAPLTGATRASHMRFVLYYKRARQEDSGWAMAGWLKDSLNAALAEQPLLAGRLRRRDEDEGLEVRLNDAGVRLVQAQAEVTMEEFLAAEDREAKEAHLVSWVDIDEETPQFSALFYIQVTSFLDDGYSLGISCSLLLADPLFVSGFLHSWSQIHTKLQAQGLFSKTPIFDLGNFKRAGQATYLKSTPMDSTPGHGHYTVLFDYPAGGAAATVAAACLEEAARKVEETSEFSLIVAGVDRMGELELDESWVKELSAAGGRSVRAPSVVDWGVLHFDRLAFGEGNKPVRVSHDIIAAGGDRPLVVAMPPLTEGGRGLISVTFPKRVQ